MTIPPLSQPLLRVDRLEKHFGSPAAPLRAVDGVTFALDRGETLGLVGESGCGKTTLARTLVRLNIPSSGTAQLDGEDIFAAHGADLQALRRRMQMIFQDPYETLNPRFSIFEIISEAWQVQRGALPRKQWRAKVDELLRQVGLGPEHAGRYPHEFSGGQRQRIGIARALALDPAVLICDEPVSALDVSVQAQVVTLLARLQRERGLAMLFVAHDLAIVRQISHRVAVMYLGRLVETGPVERIFSAATHPYTQALLSAAPVPDPIGRSQRRRIILAGDPPSPVAPPSGCRFRTRCWKAADLCARETPQLEDRLGVGTQSACHFPEVQKQALGVTN